MMPLDNKHTEFLQEYTCGPFKEAFVEQVTRARDQKKIAAAAKKVADIEVTLLLIKKTERWKKC